MSRSHVPLPPPAQPLIHEAAALHRAGRVGEATKIYRRILKSNPHDPDALHLLGLALSQQGDPRGGLASINQALHVRDNFPDAHLHAARLAGQMGDVKVAEHHARKAAAYQPSPATYENLGRVLRAQQRHEEALAAFRSAHECNPRDIDGRIAYTRGLRMTDDMQTMLSVAEAGLQQSPDHPTLQLVASEAHFGLGHFPQGWRAYRYRFRSLENRAVGKTYPLPTWEGEDLKDRAILIWAEQGPGDEIMYASMYADVIACARRCIIQCSPRLAPVMRRSFPTAEIFDRDLEPEELSGIDLQTPAASIGEWLRPTRGSFPTTTGYLKPDSDARERLRKTYLGDDQNRLLVGIAWRSTNATNAADKSLNILEWGPIFNVPGVVFVNLQYGDCAQELRDASAGFRVPIIDDRAIDPLKNMDAYTAQVAAMDLVVSSSNTAAHVAGALGVPVICMLPRSLDAGRRWYWFLEENRTPWYPSMRLLVQQAPGQWLDVIRDAGLEVLDTAVAKFGVAAKDYYRAISSAFITMGRSRDAEAVREHMARDPKLAAEAYVSIADMRLKARDAEGVFTYCDKAMAADAGYWRIYNLKGATLAELHRFDEAIATFKQGLLHNERSHQLHNNLGRSLFYLGRNDEALHHYQRALESAPPNNAGIINGIRVNYMAALHHGSESLRALEMSQEALRDDPDNVDIHYNRALILLFLERWQEGWREFAWRLKRPGANVRVESFPHVKPWAGESPAGKKILVWTEQGIGDEILISTMIPDVIDVARETVVLCSERLVPLFRRSFPGAQVEVRKPPLAKSAAATDFDFQMSMSDLGLAFRPKPDAAPARQRILIPDSHRTEALRSQYKSRSSGNLLVGISWASPKNTEMGWLKASRLQSWRPILEVPGVTFINLQYGDQTAALAGIRRELGIDIVNDTSIDPLTDMDAFAAQVAAMDLVISTSNTLVHTAGAVGTPTWILLPEGRGRLWYWLRGREDSPWYPSVRLIRQQSPKDWTLAIDRCARELRQLSQDQNKKENGSL